MIDQGIARIEENRTRLDSVHRAWGGTQPAAYLSKKAAESLDKRLRRLSVNFPRLVVRSMIDRLTVTGFDAPGPEPTPGTEPEPDHTAARLWALWQAAGLVAGSELIHADRALYGAAYVTVWGSLADPARPVAMLDNPRSAYVDTDPATGEVRYTVRYWKRNNTAHAVMLTPDAMTRYSAPGDGFAGGWKAAGESITNPFGAVPTVPMVRRQSTTDYDGTSLVADVLDLSDAVAKILQDAMVTSEYFARPRRFATGLEIQEDKEGNPIDPFGESRFLQSEDPDTRFGQLDPARLDGYSDLLATLTQQIGALTGLPAHYLGLHGDQPPNADSIRASETQMTASAYSEHRQLGPEWARVAGWLEAVATGQAPRTDLSTIWDSPETRTPAQAADAAAKLHGIGVPLRHLLTDPLGYEPHTADLIIAERDRERILGAGTDIMRLLP